MGFLTSSDCSTRTVTPHWVQKDRLYALGTQNKCLLNNYNVVIPRPILFGNIVMLNIKKPAQFGTIPTLRLEAERGLSLETSNFAT